MKLKLDNSYKTFKIGSSVVQMKRKSGGVIQIQAENFLDAQKALGFAHANDRLMQMLFGRIFSQGKITQYILDSEDAFALDLLIRKIGLALAIDDEISDLSDDAKEWCAAYSEGVNSFIEAHGFPLLCKAMKLPKERWSIQDSMALIKMNMYLGLAQAQERTERFIIHALYDGVDLEFLKKLFFPHLNSLDGEIVDLIRKLQLERPYLDKQLHFQPALSNNWALAGKKSVSGYPLCANDPHLQVNRLPAVWYEAILQFKDDVQMGITLPGFPGIVMGRSKKLSASFTYGMMDTIDFFIEEIKGHNYLRAKEWKPLVEREEIIVRKKRGPIFLKFYETESGIVERKEHREPTIDDGLYLSLGWSLNKKKISSLLNSLVKFWDSDNVFIAGKLVSEIPLSANWVLADVHGNIGFQQSGCLPNRQGSGLHPLPAWKPENLWKGFIKSESLSCTYNPECGFVATANDDKNQPELPISISAPYASYRYDRICQILSQEKKFNFQDMKSLQCDLYSTQAEKFFMQIKEMIPSSALGDILKKWDCKYTSESIGATLFEAFYFELLEEVFSKYFGNQAFKTISSHHSLLVFIHGHFDRLLLSNDPALYGSEGKESCFKRVLAKSLEQFSENVPTWGEKNQFKMTNLFFGGKLPTFLGFDVGPLRMPGSRATVAASFVFRERHRVLAAAASYRMITDLSSCEAQTILAGGPSEHRFSAYYKSDVSKWLSNDYKFIEP